MHTPRLSDLVAPPEPRCRSSSMSSPYSNGPKSMLSRSLCLCLCLCLCLLRSLYIIRSLPSPNSQYFTSNIARVASFMMCKAALRFLIVPVFQSHTRSPPNVWSNLHSVVIAHATILLRFVRAALRGNLQRVNAFLDAALLNVDLGCVWGLALSRHR
jgi:hypothetical protein